MAVENLLQRCTSKRHGSILKHTETNKEEQQVYHKSTDELARKGKQAMGELDVIAAYMVDFNSIQDTLRRQGVTPIYSKK
mmetsp:Transcript_3380/g.4258  ORF Transcript_3380/g.4258 Transcript_3380/m.4258 type:complete len:80 (-) Transcript_3380:595-834(-)